MKSHTHVPVLTALLLMLGPVMTAGTALAQSLSGEPLVKALQKGGYIVVMRHTSSPRDMPDKQAANPDNVKPER
jgi:hypothetical protein